MINVDTTPCKRGRPKKVAVCLDDRYPALTMNDNVSEEEERSAFSALVKEMKSEKPRRDIFLPLMKSTFFMRRDFILRNATSVSAILQDYPVLKEASAVSIRVI